MIVVADLVLYSGSGDCIVFDTMDNLHTHYASNITGIITEYDYDYHTAGNPPYNNTVQDYSLYDRSTPLSGSLTGVFVLLIGILGNLATLGFIIHKKWFEKVTFAAIALLALADLMALVVNGTSFIIYAFGSFHLKIFVARNLLWIAFIAMSVSNLHVVILARLRYQLIAYPFKSLTIQPRDLVKLSLAAWITSGIFGLPVALCNYYMLISELRLFRFVCVFFLFLEIIVPVVIYHCLKVKRLKELRQPRQHVITKMSTMITVIISVQIILYFSEAIKNTLLVTGRLTTFKDVDTSFIIIQNFLLLNYAINPIIYFFSVILYRGCPVCFTRRDNSSERREQNQIEVETRV